MTRDDNPYPRRPDLSIEEALALTSKAGSDQQACWRLIDHYAALIWSYPRRRGRDRFGEKWSTSRLQEWFAWATERVCKKFASYEARGGAPLEGFLAGTALKSLFNDWQRASERRDANTREYERAQDALSAAADEPSSETLLRDAEALRALYDVLARLSRDHRLALLLPDAVDRVPAADLEELARQREWSLETTHARVLAACRAPTDVELVELLVPARDEAERSPDGYKRRRNRLQQWRSRAQTKVRAWLNDTSEVP